MGEHARKKAVRLAFAYLLLTRLGEGETYGVKEHMKQFNVSRPTAYRDLADLQEIIEAINERKR